jgi:hypothetical protein
MALAVCLLFDARGDRAIRALWDQLETLGVPAADHPAAPSSYVPRKAMTGSPYSSSRVTAQLL